MNPRQPAHPQLHIGCAGWNLPRALQSRFPGTGTHLARYSALMPAVEINSSFYRSHRPATYARWAQSVPETFRFSVKIPKVITHELKLADSLAPLDEFLDQAAGLGDRLGCLLVQLPPGLGFDARIAQSFFERFRERHDGAIALEPRHADWFTDGVDRLLRSLRIARVRADPVVALEGMDAGGWPELVYFRLHGAPRIYYSSYGEAFLDAIARRLAATAGRGIPVWCIFDNTARGAAGENARDLLQKTGGIPG
jgi:uncharacterized protein YecE (DUF72 family)